MEVVGEARSKIPADVATHELFANCNEELKVFGMSLDDGVRLRVWGRDKDARTVATTTRAKILTGNKRVASSSFVSQHWFESDAAVGLELLAMKSSGGLATRQVVDFEPPRNYLYFLACDDVIFFSGFTSEAANLKEQVHDVLQVYDQAMSRAGTGWDKVRKLNILLQRGYDIGAVRDVFANGNAQQVLDAEFTFVDGFAGGKYLIEIEATAVKG